MSRMNSRLVYLHMPKTGGTWVARVLARHIEGTCSTNICHEPLRHIHIHSPSSRGKYTFGTIRNPWDWYLSWWQHGMSDRIDREYLQVYGRGSTEFRDVLWGATHANQIDLPVRIGALWPIYRTKDLEVAGNAAFMASGVGVWTWIAWDMYGSTEEQQITIHALVDTDQLYEGLSEILGQRINPEGWPPMNTRQDRPQSAVPGDPRALYDAEMLQWVWEADGTFARSLGYTEPFQPMAEAVVRLRPPPM